MFVTLSSLLGGKPLCDWKVTEKRIDKDTLRVEPETTPRVIKDYYAWKLGYCDECGVELFVKPSVAQKIVKFCKSRLG